MTVVPAEAPASVGVPVNVDSPGLTTWSRKCLSSCQRRRIFPEYDGTELPGVRLFAEFRRQWRVRFPEQPSGSSHGGARGS